MSAPPGSGKTTLLPLWLLEHQKETVYLLIPKRLAVVLAAKQLTANLGEQLGERIGYRLRLEAKTSRKTQLIVTTYGSFIRMLLNDPDAIAGSTVILDEFHERSTDQDFCYALLNQYVELFDDSLKRIVMSATFNSQKIEQQTSLPRVESAGYSHPLEVQHQKASKDWLSDIALAASRQWQQTDDHLLVFLPGLREIRKVESKLPNEIPTVILHSQLNQAPDIKRLNSAEPTVILATNIAESSLTLPRVRTVLDSGYERFVTTDANTGINQLKTRRISQASATQRAGRAARLGPGTAFRLWSKDDHQQLIDHHPPELTAADMTELYLLSLSWGSLPDQLPWLDNPSDQRINAAKEHLLAWKAINQASELTEHGKAMISTGLSPWIAHLLVTCHKESKLTSGAYLAAHLSLNEEITYDPLTASSKRSFSQAVQSEARKLADRMNCKLEETFEPLTEETLVQALPDRLLYWHTDSRGQLFSGTQVQSSKSVCSGQWQVFIDGIQTGSVIQLSQALDISQTAVRSVFPAIETVEFISRSQSSYFLKTESIGAIRLSEQKCSPGPELKAEAWLNHVSQKGEKAFIWNDENLQLKQRWLFAAAVSAIPAWPSSRQWCDLASPYFSGLKKLSELDIKSVLLQSLDYEQQNKFKNLFPLNWQAPSGRAIPLHYDFANSKISAQCKLQEAFGLEALPAFGACTLSLELTAPNGRPVAIVTDMKHFWHKVYPDVRKELRGRYSKHPWPEDPLTFKATSKTNRQISAES